MAALESINLKSIVILLFLGLFVFSSIASYYSYFFGTSQSNNSFIQRVYAQSKSSNSTFSVNCKKGFEPSSSGKECVPIPSPSVQPTISRPSSNLGTSPLNPIRGTPYEFALKYDSGNFASARNIIYRIHFAVNSGTFKIAGIGKGSFDSITSPTPDSIEFHTGKLLKGQSKIGRIVVDFGNNVGKKVEAVIRIDTTINGITRTQTVDPGIEEALGIGTGVFNFIGTAFNTSFNIYTRVTPCFSLQLSPNGNNPGSPTYSIVMENCALHPEHINLSVLDLPTGVQSAFDSQYPDIPSNQTRASHLTLFVPTGLTGRHIFTVNGDVVINTFGRYFAVTSSPGSSFFGIGAVQPPSAPIPAPSAPSAPSCFFMIAGHCLIPNF